MSHRPIKTALISVYDKTGIVEFARALATEFGIEIISTGGTARLLMDNGLPVTLVEEITGFPEMLDGRVKTLHPRIFAGILADRDNPDHMRQLAEQGIKPIDMVVVNLYPFAETVADPNCTFEQAIEMIDIGGVALLRAAAKSSSSVFVVASPEDYDYVLHIFRGGEKEWDDPRFPRLLSPGSTEFRAAVVAMKDVAEYDARIMSWLSRVELPQTPTDLFIYKDWGALKYGENPHQEASMWEVKDDGMVNLTVSDRVGDHCYQDDSSLTNYLDLDAGVSLCGDIWRGLNPDRVIPADCDDDSDVQSDGNIFSPEFHCACIMKHTNACGVGISLDPIDAYRKAYLGHPKAAMGGALISSFPLSDEFVEAVASTYPSWGKTAGAGGFFLDVWAAPYLHVFPSDMIEEIRARKEWLVRTRFFSCEWLEYELPKRQREYRNISGGLLTQTRDTVGLNESDWKVVTRRSPTESEMSDLRLAWLVAKHTKSNAISICKDGMLIGNGAGQMSRVMSCRIAVWLAEENGHKAKLAGSVAASDAFFPFDDGPKLLIDAGVTCIIQPGGSKRDEEVIRACDERDVAMIFTGIRHFRH